jgi:NTP pyrophosphatase (non-canonical NTP hydrolase)
MNNYQSKAFESMLPKAYQTNYLIPGLVAEAGEVAGVFAKWVRDGGDYEALRVNMKKELGDVLWFVAMTARYFGYTLEEVAEGNIEKLQSRKERGVLSGSGDNR